jgi:lipopolysaccharide/colanic/teichoic acid biosynthesis glycosyltransferase
MPTTASDFQRAPRATTPAVSAVPSTRSEASPTPPSASGPLPVIAAAPDWAALAPEGFYFRAGQRLLSVFLVLALAPLALALALPIACVNLVLFRDVRRILFTQDRVGRLGRVFRIYKFRTMKEPKSSSFESWSQGEDQARVTAFGRFLRNTHLDELPQLCNVLFGDMSLIGPRPEMLEIDAWARAAVPGFERRLVLWPGLTGRAQITQGYAGRHPESYAAKLAADEAYRARFGLCQDLWILAATVLWILRGRGWRWRDGELPRVHA